MLRISNITSPAQAVSFKAQQPQTKHLSEMGYNDTNTGEWIKVKVFQEGEKMITSKHVSSGQEISRNAYKAIGKMINVVG